MADDAEIASDYLRSRNGDPMATVTLSPAANPGPVPLSRAPWTPTEVESLNAYQAAGVMHPFTCGNDSAHYLLRAAAPGWECPCCEYTQDWAHPWMADWSWRRIFGTSEKAGP
jgi:hypothetical protein